MDSTRLASTLGVLLLASVGALGASAAQDEPKDPGFVERAGARYVVRFHGGDEALAEKALEVCEQVWPVVAEAFGAPQAEPAKPLTMNLHRTVEGYVEAEGRLTGGKFARNLAMAHWATRSAHVAVQPPCGDEALRGLGLPAQTVILLAWEATHLARMELCPATFAEHPNWLSDGLAGWVARRVSERAVPCTPESMPYWAKDMMRTRRLLEARKLPSIESFLSDSVADLDLEDRYATRIVLYSYFAGEEGAKLGKLLRTMRGYGGGSGVPERARKDALAAFRGQDKAFAKHVAALRPEWDEAYRGLTTSGRAWVQIAFPEKNAIAWRVEPVESRTFAATGALRILPGGAQQLNFLLARTDEGFLSIAFVADSGFTVFDYRSGADEWNRLGVANAPALRLGIRTGFEIQAKQKELIVTVDGRSWTYELPRPLPEAITWGLGAQAGSAGVWHDVVVKE
jgi:hypothetical protein